MSAQAASLETPVGGLFASTPEPLPFAPVLDIRAFVLRRDAGNVLLYSTAGLARDAAAIDALGGVARQYLGHHHEAMFAPDGFEAPVFVHEADRRGVGDAMHVRATFGRRHRFGDDLEVIPMPGHTPGSTAYLWDTGEHRVLFTADSVYLRADGEWVGAVLGSSDRRAYVESLELLRDLDFDVLAPWAAGHGEPFVAMTGRADARRRLDAILVRVLRGESG